MSLKVNSRGELMHEGRWTATLACQMHFQYYPADTQKCFIDLRSCKLCQFRKHISIGSVSVVIVFHRCAWPQAIATCLERRFSRHAPRVVQTTQLWCDIGFKAWLACQRYMINPLLNERPHYWPTKHEHFVFAGRVPIIRFTISLRRKMSYHVIQTYLPSSLFVFISWLSFLIPSGSTPERLGCCMTTLLTLTAMFSAVR